MHQGRPHCCQCYEQLYAASCSTCHRTIGVSDGHMVHGAYRWHANDVCYSCESCSMSLLGREFVMAPDDDKIYCIECGVQSSSTVPDGDVFAVFNEEVPPSKQKLVNCDKFGETMSSRAERPDVVSDSVAFVDSDRSGKDELVDRLNGIDLTTGETLIGNDVDVAVPSHVPHKSRKTKNVRFDPSTKDARSPASRDVYRQYAKSMSGRSGANSDCICRGCSRGRRCTVDYVARRHSHHHHRTRDFDGMAQIEQCTGGDVDAEYSSTAQNGWMSGDGDTAGIHEGDCSTCSSSSSDSEFDYDAYLPPISQRSQTLPSSSRRSTTSIGTQGDTTIRKAHSRRHKSKNCVVS